MGLFGLPREDSHMSILHGGDDLVHVAHVPWQGRWHVGGSCRNSAEFSFHLLPGSL